MTRRPILLLFLRIIAIGLTGLLLWHAEDVRPANGHATEMGAGQSPANHFWFGPHETIDSTNDQWLTASQLRDIAKRTEDQHALYEIMRKRPEPEAKVLALQAGWNCGPAYREKDGLSQRTPDWNTYELDVRMKIASDPMMAESLKQRRLAALSGMKARCAGFSRPNSLPTNDEWRLLLAESAKLGIKEAAGFATTSDVSDEALHALADDAIRSTDPADTVTAISTLVINSQNARNDQIRNADARLLIAANTLTAFEGDNSSRMQTMYLNKCASEGVCEEDIKQLFLKPMNLTEEELAAAKSLLHILQAEVAKHNPEATFDWRRL